ncbi:hypothetical protein NDA11_006411 [Ustilago hordei]|nr:hypothetical protein NDA10_000216 [Ustilago hordei]KAJ1570989.1 hypothetical protein NDA11_006411 [Ustilago hordei]UTT96742.1 hypothetical protein NDA17_003956 [Ustilago hordei]
MEVTRTASTSQKPSAPPPHHPSEQSIRAPPSKRPRPDIIAPSSPSKSRILRPEERSRLASHAEQSRLQANLLSYAEARARASSTYALPPPAPATLRSDGENADFRYPPDCTGGSSGSARGLLEQIKNRMDQRAPAKSSNFLQMAKQVQQSLLEKQQHAAEMQRLRDEAARRESFRSGGFGDEHVAPSSASQSAPAEAGGSAFARAKKRPSPTSDEDDPSDDAASDTDLADDAVQRDENLTLIESLRPGPRAIPTNSDDPKWEKFEPFSGHRLRERKLPHSQLKEHLRGRYHIPPSLLYSIARPITAPFMADGRTFDWKAGTRNGDYEVPIDGDWIVIATIVEKSELLVTKGFENDSVPSGGKQRQAEAGEEDDDPVLFKVAGGSSDKLRLDLEPGNSDAFQQSSNSKPWQKRRNGEPGERGDDESERKRQEHRLYNRPRKFVVLKLVDLGISSLSTDGQGSAGRGDNYLSLVAYESDQIDTSVLIQHKTSIRSEVSAVLSSSTKKWVNGSKGAFELLYQQSEGTLVAIMNPKVLRPFTSGGGRESKMLRITPRSVEDCLVIGQAADYKRCTAIKANGERCKSFVDVKARKQTRTTTCDFHLSKHMDDLARGRPEFAANSTTRLNAPSKAGAGGGEGGGRSGFGSSTRHRRGAEGEEGSAINNITITYKSSGSNAFSRAALAKKLNSSHGNVGDGMENNSGGVFVSQSPLIADPNLPEEVRASDPSSWKYDVSGRYGRGITEKQSRLKRQIEEEQLMRQIEKRFVPAEEKKQKQKEEEGERKKHSGSKEGGKDEKEEGEVVLPVLPNGVAEMINAAYSTLNQRKRVAQEKRDNDLAKRRKYTGVVVPSTTTTSDATGGKLKFKTPVNSSSSTTGSRGLSIVGGLPVAGLTRHNSTSSAGSQKEKGPDSKSKLLSLATSDTAKKEPNLKIKRAHRPKIRLPAEEVGRIPQFSVVGGELVNVADFDDDGWDDDLDDVRGRDAEEEGKGLGEKLLELSSQSQTRGRINHQTAAGDDSDSDLEII